jgi:hypothetical protein
VGDAVEAEEAHLAGSEGVSKLRYRLCLTVFVMEQEHPITVLVVKISEQVCEAHAHLSDATLGEQINERAFVEPLRRA